MATSSTSLGKRSTTALHPKASVPLSPLLFYKWGAGRTLRDPAGRVCATRDGELAPPGCADSAPRTGAVPRLLPRGCPCGSAGVLPGAAVWAGIDPQGRVEAPLAVGFALGERPGWVWVGILSAGPWRHLVVVVGVVAPPLKVVGCWRRQEGQRLVGSAAKARDSQPLLQVLERKPTL